MLQFENIELLLHHHHFLDRIAGGKPVVEQGLDARDMRVLNKCSHDFLLSTIAICWIKMSGRDPGRRKPRPALATIPRRLSSNWKNFRGGSLIGWRATVGQIGVRVQADVN